MHIRAGEQVILYSGSVSLPRLSTVKRVTPTGRIILADYYETFRPDGKPRSGSSASRFTTYIQEATPENLAAMEKERHRRLQSAYMGRLRTALQMYTQDLNMEEIEALLGQLGVALPAKE